MWELLRKYRGRLALGLVLLAAFVFYALNLKYRTHANAFERGVQNVSAPLFRVTARTSAAVRGVWTDYFDLVGVRKENRQLRESVKVLNTRLNESREASLENERLKRLLALKGTLAVSTMAASVIGEDAAPWFKTVLIDRGETDGIREGMAVVTSEGVVGQVVKVAKSSSRVLLVTDNASGVAAVVQRSRARGVAKGKGAGRCFLDFTQHQEDVKVGDLVVTSGVGGVFPKGLPIGEVTMVKKGEFGIFQTIELRPAVTIGRLEEVLVLQRQKDD